MASVLSCNQYRFSPKSTSSEDIINEFSTTKAECTAKGPISIANLRRLKPKPAPYFLPYQCTYQYTRYTKFSQWENESIMSIRELFSTRSREITRYTKLLESLISTKAQQIIYGKCASAIALYYHKNNLSPLTLHEQSANKLLPSP
jgi:hypothetical protein